MRFGLIPTRPYGKTDPSWWNVLAQAGAFIETILGVSSGAIGDTAFTFADNQSSAANVTGLLFSSANGKSAYVWCAYKRTNGTTTRYGWAELFLRYNDDTASWVLCDQVEHGDPSGITFSVTAAGQLQYTTDSIGGTYSGASHLSAYTMGT